MKQDSAPGKGTFVSEYPYNLHDASESSLRKHDVDRFERLSLNKRMGWRILLDVSTFWADTCDGGAWTRHVITSPSVVVVHKRCIPSGPQRTKNKDNVWISWVLRESCDGCRKNESYNRRRWRRQQRRSRWWTCHLQSTLGNLRDSSHVDRWILAETLLRRGEYVFSFRVRLR